MPANANARCARAPTTYCPSRSTASDCSTRRAACSRTRRADCRAFRSRRRSRCATTATPGTDWRATSRAAASSWSRRASSRRPSNSNSPCAAGDRRDLSHSTAQVIWTREEPRARYAGMGLRFLALDRIAARALAEWVEERTPHRRPTRGVRPMKSLWFAFAIAVSFALVPSAPAGAQSACTVADESEEDSRDVGPAARRRQGATRHREARAGLLPGAEERGRGAPLSASAPPRRPISRASRRRRPSTRRRAPRCRK